MDLQSLAEQAASYGMRMVDGRFTGIQNGYPYVVSPHPKKEQVVLNFTFDQAISGEMKRSVKKAVKKLPFRGVAMVFAPTAVSLTISSPVVDVLQRVVSVISVLVETFAQGKKPLLPPKRCGLCNKDGADSAAFVAHVQATEALPYAFRPVHKDCLVKRTEKNAAKAEKNERQGSVSFGIIGALLGAVLGALPTVLTIVFMRVEFGYAYLLIPLLSYGGYKLFRGHAGIAASVSVVIASILSFAIMQPLKYYALFLKEGVAYVSLEMVLDYMRSMQLAEIVEDTWFGLLFLVIGIFASFKGFGKTNRDIVNEAETEKASLMSLNGEPVMVTPDLVLPENGDTVPSVEAE